MAAKTVDWETDTLWERLLGRCVKVTGWMLFDAEHRRHSQNTADARAEVWRATAWEIHPYGDRNIAVVYAPVTHRGRKTALIPSRRIRVTFSFATAPSGFCSCVSAGYYLPCFSKRLRVTFVRCVSGLTDEFLATPLK